MARAAARKAPKAAPAARAKPLAKSLEKDRRAAARIARDNVRTERLHLATARTDARDVVRNAPKEAKAEIMALRGKLRGAIAMLRDMYVARRRELAREYRADGAQLRAEVKARTAEIKLHVTDAKAQARALVELRREALAKARSIAAAYVSAASRTAGRRTGERFSEAMHVATNQVEHAAPELVPAFAKWARTKVARATYRDAVAALKKAHPRGDWRHSDAGEWIAVFWLEKAEDEIDTLKHDAWTSAEECYERAAIRIEAFDLSDPDQAREADAIWATCKEYGA